MRDAFVMPGASRLLRGLAVLATFVLALPCPAVAAASSDAALSEALAPPITLELMAAQRAPVLAWIVRTAGKFKLKTANAPLFAPRTIWTGGDDDGLPISLIGLSPDGSSVAFVRGEPDSPNGRTPNPASLAAGAQRMAFIMPASGGTPTALPPGDGFAFSPQGDRLAWIAGNGVMAAPILRGAAGKIQLGKAALLVDDIGEISEFGWSPDGHAIAFSSHREGHSIVGVFREGKRDIVWLAPTLESDTSPAWSPDGRRIAFVRVPSRDYDRPGDVMTDFPFSILVADALTGSGRAVFHSKGADGSAIAENALQWSAAGEILFLSDESGFSHLYAVGPANGVVRPLTRGQCDVEAVSLNASRLAVAIVSNCLDRMRRQVERIDLAGPAALPVSNAGEIADAASFIGTSDTIAYRAADYRAPQTPAIAAPGGRSRRIDPPVLGAAVMAFREPRSVEFKAADGQTVTGTLFEPPPGTARSRGIVFVHGGPIRQMMPGWHVGLYYALTYANNQALARQGFTVLAVNYRLGVGFGRAFRNVEGYGPHGQRELQDVVAAGAYLQSLPVVDAGNIGIYGGSVGGYLTAAALARHSDLFKAGVAWHGIYDWARWATNPTPHMNFVPWGIDAGNLESAKASSPVNQVGSWTSPVLLVAGDDDRNVDIAETILLAHRLQRKGVDVETLVVPNGLHSFGTQRGWDAVFRATDEFLARKLK